jgi:predicted nucleic acid-binding protein
MTRTSYVDASGLVKLVIDEAETREMVRWYVESDRVLTSVIGVIETRRAAARRPHDAGHLAHVLDRVEVLAVAPDIAERAGSILPAMLRTLDAIHLATALTAEPGIDAFVTYDDRLAAAARDLGLPVVSPV